MLRGRDRKRIARGTRYYSVRGGRREREAGPEGKERKGKSSVFALSLTEHFAPSALLRRSANGFAQ